MLRSMSTISFTMGYAGAADVTRHRTPHAPTTTARPSMASATTAGAMLWTTLLANGTSEMGLAAFPHRFCISMSPAYPRASAEIGRRKVKLWNGEFNVIAAA
jgi:hypothetical protein